MLEDRVNGRVPEMNTLPEWTQAELARVRKLRADMEAQVQAGQETRDEAAA